MREKMISVLLSVYNREQYLRKCIDSVLAQNADFELIIVEDGSTDGSGAICDEYAKEYSNIRVIHQKNQGISVARNVALDEAKGDFIMFLDSDDYLPTGSFETLLRLQEENDADCVAGNYACCNDDGSFDKVIDIPDKYNNRLLTNREICELLLYSGETHVLIVSWGKLFKREVWDNIRFPNEVVKSEDQFVFPALMEKMPRFYYTNKIVYNQVFSNSSITRSPFSREHLFDAEGVAIVIGYLMDKGYYDIALYKFGVGTRRIINMKRVLEDNESKAEIKRLYKVYCDIAEKLSPHLTFKNKLRMALYRINMDVYAHIRDRMCHSKREIL